MSAPRDVACIQCPRGAPDNQETMKLEEADVHRDTVARLKALVGTCSDAVSVHTAKGITLFANSALASMLGLESSDLVGHNLCEFVHDEDIAVIRDAFDLTVTGVGAGEVTNYRLDDAHGSWHTVESVSTNLLDEPIVDGIILTTRDVTPRVQPQAS
jgi:PAS domain S-box-containing protein